jgi:hypothetical protein
MMKEKRIEPSDQPGEAEEEETSATPTDFYPQTRQGQPRGAVFFCSRRTQPYLVRSLPRPGMRPRRIADMGGFCAVVGTRATMGENMNREGLRW